MPIRTIRDLDLLEGSGSVSAAAVANSSGKKVAEMKIAHIPTLTQCDSTWALLRRIHNEFYPIAQRRGFNVISLSEMCCCGDGLDHGVLAENGKRRKRRKRKIMAANILGYNQTHFAKPKKHTIHLRLREPHNHDILKQYEEVAGTMAHELAHCIHGPHDAKFYKLMDEIQQQHAVYLTRGLIADQGGFPMNSNQAHVLGRRSGNNKNNPYKKSAGDAAQARVKNQKQKPQRLGGDSSLAGILSAGEMAAAAAQARRLEDEKWCLPCDENHPIELLESDEDDNNGDNDNRKLPAAVATAPTTVMVDDDNENMPTRVTPAAESGDNADTETAVARPKRITPTPTATATIDLTGDSDNDGDRAATKQKAAAKPKAAGWPCSQCTYRNEPSLVVCAMCGSEQPNVSSRIISKIMRDDTIQLAKEREVEQSERDFGFNIYGDSKEKTSKMKHIT